MYYLRLTTMAIMKIITTEYKEVPLKKMREAKGLSLRQLADLAGVSFGQINKVENGLYMSEEFFNKLNIYL